jgi:uncharacterized protein YndB with AHSA1/START domain
VCRARHGRQSVSKHLAVVEAANLLTTVRRGRVKLHYLNPAPINDIAERWINRYDRPRVQALADLKRALEHTGGQKPEFVYTTYIHTTPERLWQALTDAALTRRWWGTTFQSDWHVGSTVTWEREGVVIADPAQVVLESQPFRRLAYSWHTMTPELAASVGVSDEQVHRLTAERRLTASFDIEPLGELVRLAVVHGDFGPGSAWMELISEGWPRLLSGSKTLLETDAALPRSADSAE